MTQTPSPPRFEADADGAPSDASKRKASALRPRLAASLILTRPRRSGATEILLGRRSGEHVFMPRKYVFPGGRVDRRDGFAPLAGELKPEAEAVMTRVLTPRRARAAAAAALRETAEETGVLIAEPGAPTRSGDPAWSPFLEAGARPTAEPLLPVARAITPPGRPRRFDAWFFRTDYERALDPAGPLAGSGELEDLRWATLEEAERLDIPLITRFVLAELKAQLAGERMGVRCARVTRSGPKVDPV